MAHLKTYFKEMSDLIFQVITIRIMYQSSKSSSPNPDVNEK